MLTGLHDRAVNVAVSRALAGAVERRGPRRAAVEQAAAPDRAWSVRRGVVDGPPDLAAAADVSGRYLVADAAYRAEMERRYRVGVEGGADLADLMAPRPEDRHRMLALWRRVIAWWTR